MKVITVEKNEAGQRLDKLLAKHLNKAPKSFIYKMLRKKNITLNGKKADGSEKVDRDDEIKLFLSDETIANFSENYISTTVEGDVAIVYEDENILVLNKEAGMLSQKADKDDISLVEYIISYLLKTKQISEEELQTFKPGISNRLDRNTTGLVVAGKTLLGLQEMAKLFHDRTVDKYYLCIVKGNITKPEKIRGYLVKNEKTNQVTIHNNQVKDGELIQTEYEPIKVGTSYTLLKVKLITGKTHQIRAHLSSIGHPLIGDSKYGDNRINQVMKKRFGLDYQLLHSYQLNFPTMVGELENLSNKVITCEVPTIFGRIEKELF